MPDCDARSLRVPSSVLDCLHRQPLCKSHRVVISRLSAEGSTSELLMQSLLKRASETRRGEGGKNTRAPTVLEKCGGRQKWLCGRK